MRGTRLGAFLVIAACSEFSLSDQKGPEDPIATVPEPSTTDDTQTTPTVDTGSPLPEPSCADTASPSIAWVASPAFAQAADPADAAGTVFWDPAFDTSSWNVVVLPDRDIPIGDDRAYVGLFDLAELPVDLSLNLQSDDGIVVWVNGVFVGQWGGDWQLEGCVNENAQCLVTTDVDPVDVTGLLHLGLNVVAARVSNPVQNAYFEIIPECIDRVR